VSSNETGVNLEDIRAMIAEELELPVEEVTDDADLKTELEMDSLAAMEVAVQLEKKYQIKIEEEEVKSLTSLAAIYKLVSAKAEKA
jgi:acyl carrier protein